MWFFIFSGVWFLLGFFLPIIAAAIDEDNGFKADPDVEIDPYDLTTKYALIMLVVLIACGSLTGILIPEGITGTSFSATFASGMYVGGFFGMITCAMLWQGFNPNRLEQLRKQTEE